MKTQLELQQKCINDADVNIVTCGNCGTVILHETPAETINCNDCNFESDICDFPDLNY